MSDSVDCAVKMLDYMRTGARLNSRIKVALEWNEEGHTHKAEGVTVDISPKGCMAVSTEGLVVGQKIHIRNVLNQKVAEARIIWRGHQGRTGWEVGLELLDPPADFWGVDF